jgi:predicted Fe-Mo cluster-binding NifX family protein
MCASNLGRLVLWKGRIMIIAMTAREPEFETELEPRFGRAPYFILVETETGEWRTVKNAGAGASGGAGTQAAQILSEEGVKALICGRVGPKASDALEAANIDGYRSESRALGEVLDAFKGGGLSRI